MRRETVVDVVIGVVSTAFLVLVTWVLIAGFFSGCGSAPMPFGGDAVDAGVGVDLADVVARTDACAGCWNAGACVLSADQTIDVCGGAAEQCHPTPITCTGQAAAPCPINTAPALQLAYREPCNPGPRRAICCPANVCSLDACTPAP